MLNFICNNNNLLFYNNVIFQANTRLTQLDLRDNHLGYEGGREIATVLLVNNFVTHLVSHYCKYFLRDNFNII